MFRKQVNPKTTAIVTLLTLGAIQGIYWRTLVYRPPSPPLRPGGLGGQMPAPVPQFLGPDSVLVENWVGEEAGYRDGAAWEARLCGPNGLALQNDGTILVADSRNHCLRAITATGRVSTLAGGGPDRAGSAVGPASAARFRFPSGVAALPDGAIVIADTGNHRLCRLKDGQVTLLAGGAKGSRDGKGPSAQFDNPGPMTLDRSGRLWVLDAGNRKLRSVDAAGEVTTPAETPVEVREVLGQVLEAPSLPIWGSPDGRSEPLVSEHRSGRRGVAAYLPSGGRAYGDLTNQIVCYQKSGGNPVVLAGRVARGSLNLGTSEGTGARTQFATPASVVAAPGSILYVADYDGNRIRRVRLAGTPFQ